MDIDIQSWIKIAAYTSSGLCMGLGAIGAAIGEGYTASQANTAISRNPDLSGNIFKSMLMGQAIAEADRCLLCHDAPCSEACPADTKPAEFIRKLRFKNMTGAIRTIKENNILGGACGVLCPTSRLCEEKCSAIFKSQNRPEGADQPIRIGAIRVSAIRIGAVRVGACQKRHHMGPRGVGDPGLVAGDAIAVQERRVGAR